MMLKKGIFTLMFIFMAVGTASCGNTNPGQENRVSGEPTVSGQAMSEQSVSGQAAEGAAMTKEITTNAAGPKIRDRIDITAEPAIDEQKQIDVIASQKNTWNMGNPTDKTSPEAYYISNFNYALTDLDQDGYVEILVFSRQGTGQYTHFSIYEINESGNGLVKWNIQRDSFAEEENVSPDFYEYPVEAYFDRSTGCYHYPVWDHMHASALDGADYLVDMAVVNNTIQMHVVTHASYGPDGEYESEDDPNSYYQGMTKRYMFYRTYDIESEKLEKAKKEAVEDLTWDLEHSWYAFAIVYDTLKLPKKSVKIP